METLLQDIRYSIRTLAKRPAFTIVAVLTLALGIGANTAIFTVVDAALIRSLPYENPGALVHLWEVSPKQDFGQHEASYPDYLDIRAQNQVFEDMAGYNGSSLTLTGRDAPERLRSARVTSSFFSVLGVKPILGRAFLEGEDQPGAERIVMLSHKLWQRRFGADPDIIGQTLNINNDTYTVVGVLPPKFKFARVGDAELWVPLNPMPYQVSRRNLYWLNVIARIKPGVTLKQAQAEMDGFAANFRQQYPESHTGVGIRLVNLHEEIVGSVKPVLLALLGAVGFVLLIACANVANLLLARAAGRRKEIAVRIALGARRSRLIQQLLTESLVLAFAGGLLGLLWALWGVELLVAAIPNSLLSSMPYLEGLTIDAGVLGFTTAITLFTGVVFGIAPALQATRQELHESLKEGGRSSGGASHAGLRNALVVAEIALALVLLVGAGLMMRSLLRLLQVDPGFDTNNLLTFQLTLPDAKYSDMPQLLAFHQQLTARIEALPGVKGAGTTSLRPLSGGGNTASFFVEGQPAPDLGNKPEANVRTISTNYFAVMGIPLIKGRTFTESDNATAPNSLVINQTLANRFFPDQDPVGQRIAFGFDPERRPWLILGVVGDEKVTAIDARTTPVIYFHYEQDAESYMGVLVRTSSDPTNLIGAVRSEINAIDQDIPMYSVMTMEQMISNSQATFMRRYPTLLIGVLAAVALLLAAVGIYGVISYSVTQRTHEIGIRMALGAQKRDIIKLVVGQGLILMLTGLGIGMGAAFALTRFLSSILFGVSATDTISFAAVSALLAIVALIACYIPARRAARVDPMIALRYE
jgi:putative ABC transport system permease protein